MAWNKEVLFCIWLFQQSGQKNLVGRWEVGESIENSEVPLVTVNGKLQLPMTFAANYTNHLPRQQKDNDAQSQGKTHNFLLSLPCPIWCCGCGLLQLGIRVFESILVDSLTLSWQRDSLSWDWAVVLFKKKWEANEEKREATDLCKLARCIGIRTK